MYQKLFQRTFLFSYNFSMSFLRDEGSTSICEYRILVVAILEDLSLNVETEMRTRYTHLHIYTFHAHTEICVCACEYVLHTNERISPSVKGNYVELKFSIWNR